MLNHLTLKDIQTSDLFNLINFKYKLHPSVNLNEISQKDKEKLTITLKLLQSGSLKLADVDYPHLFVKSNLVFEFNSELIRHQNNYELEKFKLILNFIVEKGTFFYDKKFLNIQASAYSINYLDYKTHTQECFKNVDNLLTFIVLNKEALSLFGDDKLINKIKPLIQKALQDPEQSKELHNLLIMSLHYTKSTQFLLDCGLNANYQNAEGLTSLMISTNTGVIKALFKSGADINLTNYLEQYSGSQILGISRNSKKFKPLIGKNAYEMHSTLGNNSVIKLFDNEMKKHNQLDTLAYSEHFQKEYDMIQASPSTDKLIKACKNNNSVVLDKLNEFSNYFYDVSKKINFILFCSTENKAVWLEKAVNSISHEQIKKFTRNREISSYLELAIYNKAYNSAEILLKNGMYNTQDAHFDEISKHIYDANLVEQFYKVLPQKIDFTHLLQSTHIELIEQFMKEGKNCPDTIFNAFTEATQGHMNRPIYQLTSGIVYMSRVKNTLIDCLATIIKMEPDSEIQEFRLNSLINHATLIHSNHTHLGEEMEKTMKSKIQRLLKHFPEKRSQILESISEVAPNLVSFFEEKSFNKLINKASKSTNKKTKIISSDILSENLKENVEIKPKRNKI